MKFFIICYLLSLSSVSAFCTCNTTDPIITYPCTCADYESYKICNQAYKTALNYTMLLANLVRPYLDDYYYMVYSGNLQYSLPVGYCLGIVDCSVSSANETCRRENMFSDCTTIKEIIPAMSNYAYASFIDSNIKKIIDDVVSGIVVNIDCETPNHNFITNIDYYELPNQINGTNRINGTSTRQEINIYFLPLVMIFFLIFL